MSKVRAMGAERVVFLVIAATAVVVLASLPLTLLLDSRNDRQRPMYDDLRLLAWLEDQHLMQHGTPVPVVLGPDDTATVGGERFSPQPGVTVTVTVSGERYCLRGRNEHGDTSESLCYDRANRPPEPYSPEASEPS